jgi:hypothetical protein
MVLEGSQLRTRFSGGSLSRALTLAVAAADTGSGGLSTSTVMGRSCA